MTEQRRRDQPLTEVLKVFLVVVVTCLLLVDVALLVVKPAGTQAELLRLLLAGGAFSTAVFGGVLGVVHEQRHAVGAVLSLPLVVWYGFTGLLLPWTELSFWLGQIGIELLLGVPYIGEWLAVGLFGGFTLTQANLRTVFRHHYTIVGLGTACLLYLTVVARRSPVSLQVDRLRER